MGGLGGWLRSYEAALAQDVRRLKDGLTLIIFAAQAVEEHKDESTLRTLMAAVATIGKSPALPVRDGHEPLTPEGVELAADEADLILDAAELYQQPNETK